MRYSSRFFLYAPFAMFMALAVTVMVYWWFAAAALNTELNKINGHEIMPGVTLSFSSKLIAGFPFRLDTIMEGVRIEVATTYGPFVWRTEHLATHALTYSREHMIFEAAGAQELSWRDSGGTPHDFKFVPAALRASSISSAGALERFDLDVIAVASADLAAGRVQFHVRRDPAHDALDLALSGDVLKLGPALATGLGQEIKLLRLQGEFVPRTPLMPLLAGKVEWRVAVEDWRSKGGVLQLDQFQIDWGKIHADGKGALALDRAHRLQGAFALEMSGTETLISGNARLPKLAGALGRITAQNVKSGKETYSIPLAFKDGHAFAGTEPAGFIGPLY
jgi:hypothetical protein